jgi:hypothetical protein
MIKLGASFAPLRFLDVSGKAFREFHVAMADNLYAKPDICRGGFRKFHVAMANNFYTKPALTNF